MFSYHAQWPGNSDMAWNKCWCKKLQTTGVYNGVQLPVQVSRFKAPVLHDQGFWEVTWSNFTCTGVIWVCLKMRDSHILWSAKHVHFSLNQLLLDEKMCLICLIICLLPKFLEFIKHKLSWWLHWPISNAMISGISWQPKPVLHRWQQSFQLDHLSDRFSFVPGAWLVTHGGTT